MDAVTMIWLVHLIDDPGPVLTEATRGVREGGVIIMTVNKNDAQFEAETDVNEVLRAARGKTLESDDFGAVAATLGLPLAGDTTFDGIGQGTSPAGWRRWLGGGAFGWATEELDDALGALPDQHRVRSEPRYRLASFKV
jgi:hypothetical protein